MTPSLRLFVDVECCTAARPSRSLGGSHEYYVKRCTDLHQALRLLVPTMSQALRNDPLRPAMVVRVNKRAFDGNGKAIRAGSSAPQQRPQQQKKHAPPTPRHRMPPQLITAHGSPRFPGDSSVYATRDAPTNGNGN